MNCTEAQIALAWLLHQKPYIVPILGSRKLHRLEENIKSIDVELTQNNLAKLNEALSKIKIQGDRYDETLKKATNR